MTEVGTSPWLLGGDFNAIARQSEHRGSAFPQALSMEEFAAFLSDFQELPTVGLDFSWMGDKIGGRIWRKLDRLIVNQAWSSQYQSGSVFVGNRMCSYHSPLIYSVKELTTGCRGFFRFQDMWLNRQDFKEVVKANWEQQMGGSGMNSLMFKLKRLKGCLIEWNKNVFGNVHDKVKEEEQKLTTLEAAYDDSPTSANLTSRNEAQAPLTRCLIEEEDFWRQRSGVKWLKEGEKNTAYYHQVVATKRFCQCILRIRNCNGDWIESEADIGAEAERFFQDLLTEPGQVEEEYELLNFLRYCPSMNLNNTRLEVAVTMEEVKAAVFGLSADSAPGLDGFSG